MPNKSKGPGNFPDSTDVVVFAVVERGRCWYCDTDTNLLAGPDHPPRDGGAHYTCEAHMEKGAVVQHVTSWPFVRTGVKLWRRCACCKTPTPNRLYCSVACRKNALYPDWEARRAEIIARRLKGEPLSTIAIDLHVSQSRVSAICKAAGVTLGTK